MTIKACIDIYVLIVNDKKTFVWIFKKTYTYIKQISEGWIKKHILKTNYTTTKDKSRMNNLKINNSNDMIVYMYLK
jgi:hypothetical protein